MSLTLPQRTSAQLLAIARHELTEAAEGRFPNYRFVVAHLAALRAAAAYIAVKGRPAGTASHRARSVWDLLALVAPELTDQAAYFGRRAADSFAATVGVTQVVTEQDAVEHLRAAEQFVAVVETALAAI